MKLNWLDFEYEPISGSEFENFSYVEDSFKKGVGTFVYISPVMANEEEYHNKKDVYSFGIVLHFIFANNHPK